MKKNIQDLLQVYFAYLGLIKGFFINLEIPIIPFD